MAQHGTRLAVIARYAYAPLFGITAAHAILRLLRILSYPSNRIALDQELSFSSSVKRGELEAGAVCDSLESKRLRSGAWTQVDHLRLENRSSDWSRFCDIAVVDITDLDRLKYCFTGSNCETGDVVTYLGQFSTDTIAGQNTLEAECLVRALSEFQVIEKIPVWPVGSMHFFNFGLQVQSHRGGLPLKPALKSLLHLCTVKVLDELLSTGEDHDFSFLDEVLGMPHIASFVMRHCLENADMLVKASDAISLKILTMAFKGKKYVNLAPFRNLPPATVRSLLRSLPEAQIINLSGTVAINDGELTDTLAAIDHDLDALYLLTPPNQLQHGQGPQVAVDALRNWNHKCCKVLISSMLSEEPKEGIPGRLDRAGSAYPRFETRNPYVSSKSFPVTQIIYYSTYDRPVLAHFFIGGGLVAPYRLMAGITKTIKDVHISHAWNDDKLGSSLVNSIALGPSTPNSDEYFDVRSIPVEASFFSSRAELRREYWNPASQMRCLTPDAWTAVLLRDDVSTKASSPEGGNKMRRTGRFRIVLLRPKRAISVEENQFISIDEFEYMALPTFSHQQSSSAANDLQTKVMEDHGPDRTEIQFQVGPLDTLAAITAMRKILNEAAAFHKRRSRLKMVYP
ncbi:hypothetical protein ACHAQJ_009805 [Trichoderma viride]